jgi:stringent starvation protein B
MTTDKRSVTNRFLETYSDVNLHLDATRSSVSVPKIHAKNRELVLRIGRDTSDLTVDAWGIKCALAFGGISHLCKIRWAALWAVTDPFRGEQVIWEEDRPQMPEGHGRNISTGHQEFLAAAKAGNKALAAMQEAKKQPRKLPVGWKLIKGNKQ